MTSRAGAALRQFIGQSTARKPKFERCELCSAPLAAKHQHLLEPASRRIACACDACVLLFDNPASGRYRRVPRQGRFLPEFVLSDEQWDSLLIPINMAFLFHSSPAGKIVALYPSPAGAMESLLTLEAWQDLVEANPALRGMRPDVEALLVNRLGPVRGFSAPEYYLAPIDACYKLVGLIRGHWRGFSGGSEVWQEIGAYFVELKRTSSAISSDSRPSSPGGIAAATDSVF